MNSKSNNSLVVSSFQMLTKFGRRIFTNMTILFLLGIGLMYISYITNSKNCSSFGLSVQNSQTLEAGDEETLEKTLQKYSSRLCFFKGWSDFLGNMGNSCIEVVLIVLFFEVRARQEMHDSIKQIFNETNRTKHIQAFHLKREEYSQQIHTSFRSARSQTIKLLSLVEDIHILSDEIGVDEISLKVCNGSDVKILILHPDSSLLGTFDKVGFTYDSSSSAREAYGRLPQKLEMIRKKLETERGKETVRGSIEIRAHKDIFSSIGYYSEGVT